MKFNRSKSALRRPTVDLVARALASGAYTHNRSRGSRRGSPFALGDPISPGENGDRGPHFHGVPKIL